MNMKPATLFFTTGVAVFTAAAIGSASTVAPPRTCPPPRQVELSALISPAATPNDPLSLVTDWVARVVIPPSASQPVPTPQLLPVIAPNSIGSSIKNVYNTVEPWVRYGFDLAAYAVGWVPYVGWLAPQIPIFYNFGERIARSITYNLADFLDGRVTFVQGLINVGVDTFNSFVQLGIDQLNFWLPSLPPLPPFPLAANTQASFSASPTTTSLTPLDPVRANGQGSAIASPENLESASITANHVGTEIPPNFGRRTSLPEVPALAGNGPPVDPSARKGVAASADTSTIIARPSDRVSLPAKPSTTTHLHPEHPEAATPSSGSKHHPADGTGRHLNRKN